MPSGKHHPTHRGLPRQRREHRIAAAVAVLTVTAAIAVTGVAVGHGDRQDRSPVQAADAVAGIAHRHVRTPPHPQPQPQPHPQPVAPAVVLQPATGQRTASRRPAAGRDTGFGAVGKAEQVAATPSRVAVIGKGFGHGRGLSQWGAEGAAVRGLSSRRILNFYYPGTRSGRFTGTVRVWLSAAGGSALEVTAQPGLEVRDLADGSTWTLPSTPSTFVWRLRYDRAGRLMVQSRRAGVWRRWQVPGRGTLRGVGEFVAAGPLTLVTLTGDVAYAGGLEVAGHAGAGVEVVNVVDVEDYLRGVVPAESPASWRPAALQAQAVAARTYVAYQADHARAQGRSYDICDTTACQVYGGVAAEQPATDAAVTATSGVIRTYDGAPILAEFSASNGGERAGSTVSYQRYGADAYDSWAGNPERSWTVPVPLSELTATWPQLGRVTRVRVTARDGHGPWGGRVERALLVGTRGRVRVTGDQLAADLGLRSTLFRFGALS